MLADPALRDLLHRRPRAPPLPAAHAPIASGRSNSCRVAYLPPTGSTCPFHGARFLRASYPDFPAYRLALPPLDMRKLRLASRPCPIPPAPENGTILKVLN